jgi:hypothetical protein
MPSRRSRVSDTTRAGRAKASTPIHRVSNSCGGGGLLALTGGNVKNSNRRSGRVGSGSGIWCAPSAQLSGRRYLRIPAPPQRCPSSCTYAHATARRLLLRVVQACARYTPIRCLIHHSPPFAPRRSSATRSRVDARRRPRGRWRRAPAMCWALAGHLSPHGHAAWPRSRPACGSACR